MKINIKWCGLNKRPDKLLEMAIEYAMNEGLNYNLEMIGNVGELSVSPTITKVEIKI